MEILQKLSSFKSLKTWVRITSPTWCWYSDHIKALWRWLWRVTHIENCKCPVLLLVVSNTVLIILVLQFHSMSKSVICLLTVSPVLPWAPVVNNGAQSSLASSLVLTATLRHSSFTQILLIFLWDVSAWAYDSLTFAGSQSVPSIKAHVGKCKLLSWRCFHSCCHSH